MGPHKLDDVAPVDRTLMILPEPGGMALAVPSRPQLHVLEAPNLPPPHRTWSKKLALLQYLRPAQATCDHLDVHGLNVVFVHDMNEFGKPYFENGRR